MSNHLISKNHAEAIPKVSIIVPFYNAGSTLDRCLRSLVMQNFEDFEVVLIDDGSTDNGCDIAHKHAEADSRIKIISQGNGGQAEARNNGISEAKGDYVCFVDADDYVHPTYLMRMMSALSGTRSDAAACNFMKVIKGVEAPEFDVSGDTSFTTIEALAELNYHRRFDSSAGGKIFPRRFFDAVRFPVGMKCEDAAIMHLLIAQCSSLAYVSEPLYFYERSADSTTRAKRPERSFVDDALRAIEMRRVFVEENYPEIMQSMDTESLLSIVYACGRYSINGGSIPRGELKALQNEARSYVGSCLRDRNVPRSRKLQAALFCVSPRLYVKCYALLSLRRGY